MYTFYQCSLLKKGTKRNLYKIPERNNQCELDDAKYATKCNMKKGRVDSSQEWKARDRKAQKARSVKDARLWTDTIIALSNRRLSRKIG